MNGADASKLAGKLLDTTQPFGSYSLKNIYAQVTNRLPDTVLLIVTEFRRDSSDKYALLPEKIADDEIGRKGKDNVVMMSKDDFPGIG